MRLRVDLTFSIYLDQGFTHAETSRPHLRWFFSSLLTPNHELCLRFVTEVILGPANEVGISHLSSLSLADSISLSFPDLLQPSFSNALWTHNRDTFALLP